MYWRAVDSSTEQPSENLSPPGRLPPPPDPASPAAALDVGRRTGRGGIAISAAKLYFIITGLVQQVALKAVLGLEGYGALSSSLAAASIAYNPVVGASIQGVSHALATSLPAERESALRKTLRFHIALALLLGGCFFALAPSVGRFTGAPHIVLSLRVLSLVLVLYGVYAPLVGALNGLTHFGSQAALDALAATLRTLGLVGGAAGLAGYDSEVLGGVEGAALGFTVSSFAILVVALWRVGIGRPGSGGPSLRAYLRFIGPILLGQVLLNLLFQADQLLLRRFAAEAAVSAGLDVTRADALVGAYRAIQLFCFLPYQLVLSISIVIFPVVAKAHREGDQVAVADYVRQGMRLAVIITGLIVSVTAGLSEPLLRLVFGADAALLGAAPMQLLALGLGNLALFGVLTAILNSLEKQRLGLVVTALACALVAALCVGRVRGLPLGSELLMQTALATSAALLLATLVAAWIVRREAGAVLAPRTLFRVPLALGCALLVARALPASSGVLTLALSLVVVVSYVLALIGLRELSANDWRQFQRIVAPRSAAG